MTILGDVRQQYYVNLGRCPDCILGLFCTFYGSRALGRMYILKNRLISTEEGPVEASDNINKYLLCKERNFDELS